MQAFFENKGERKVVVHRKKFTADSKNGQNYNYLQ